MKDLFIVAEVGINHNGDINIAKELIDVAKEAGCDAVKFQKRSIDAVYNKEQLEQPRESPWGKTTREQKEGLELGLEEFQEIDRYCNELGIIWFASAWDRESQLFLRNFSLKYNKVASAMMTSEPFLELVADEGVHTFISTGMSTLENIDKAVEIFTRKNCPFELMHTVSTYPMRDEDANLLAIKTLQERYNCDVGYSGHEVGIAISLGAVALGITSLERHITLDRAMYGSDQAASVEPDGLRSLVASARKIKAGLGDGVKKVIEDEITIAKKLRSHIPFTSSLP